MNEPATTRGASGLGLLMLVAVWIGSVLSLRAAEPAPHPGPWLAAPPAPPPRAYAKAIPPEAWMASALSEGLTLYSIGQPTDEEQWYVELINRARANPAAEGLRLRSTEDPDIRSAYAIFGVNLDQMAADMAALAPAPPLSVNALLTAAARLHSADMLANNFQSHTGSDGSTLSTRVRAQAYFFSMAGENIYASAESVEHGHAGFEVDWGYGPNGMQSPPGHRLNLHEPAFREVGIGVVLGKNTSVGPQLVTQDLGSRAGLTPFVTGVVYYDLNENGFYDPGEGLEGVEVTVSSSSYYAVSAASGGYSVPVPAEGSRVVTFACPGLPDAQQTVMVGTQNVKVDHVPAYTPPVVSGPDPAWLEASNRYAFSGVGGASGYEWQSARCLAFGGVEGAEQGLLHVTVSATPGYALVASDVQSSGQSSFHLAHPQAEDQVLEWNRTFRPGPASELVFDSLLGWATTNQVAFVQLSLNDGRTWQEIWSQKGTGTSGQRQFSRVTIPLGAWASQVVRVRFVYDYHGGLYYYQTSSGIGWYLDNLTVTGAEEMGTPALTSVDLNSGRVFDFVPDQTGAYVLRVRGRSATRLYDWGPTLLVNVVPAPVTLRVIGPPTLSGGRALIRFEVRSGVPSRFTVETAAAPSGPWTEDSTAEVTALDVGRLYQAEAVAGLGGARFYRVVAW